MGLKKDRLVTSTDISCYFNSVATRGGIASLQTGGSGIALDNQGTAASPKPLARYSANSSGAVPLGVLEQDTVSVDLTLYHANFHKDQVAIPGKVTIGRKGWYVTNMYIGTPAAGGYAYLSSSGYVQTTANGEANNPKIGRFWSSPDEDSYVKLEVNLPY